MEYPYCIFYYYNKRIKYKNNVQPVEFPFNDFKPQVLKQVCILLLKDICKTFQYKQYMMNGIHHFSVRLNLHLIASDCDALLLWHATGYFVNRTNLLSMHGDRFSSKTIEYKFSL